jgi:hypothetical protein
LKSWSYSTKLETVFVDVPHDEWNANDMNEDVGGVIVVGPIKSELLGSVGI